MTRTKAYKSAGKLQLPLKLQPEKTAAIPSLESLAVDSAQCKKAVKALVAHLEKTQAAKEDTELLSHEEHMFLVVTLKQMSGRDRTMPVRLPLPNPLIDPKKSPVCLLVKDPQRQYKDLLVAKHVSFITRVIGVEKLKGKFKPFEARRQLMSEYDQFLADERIIPLLPKLLGKSWLEAKKQPLPICLKRTDLKAELERVLSSTPLHLNRGTCVTIKVGTPLEQHSAEELAENILAVIPQLAVKLPLGGWKNVQALHIKTSTSASLPVWNCDLQGRFDVEKRETRKEMREAAEAKDAPSAAEVAEKVVEKAMGSMQPVEKKLKRSLSSGGGSDAKKRRKST